MRCGPRLDAFVQGLENILDTVTDEVAIVAEGAIILGDLVRHDDWLPPKAAAPHADRYQQYLLHLDEKTRFSIVSFVWGPGQGTPIHNHGVWGLVGVMRGCEASQRFVFEHGKLEKQGHSTILRPGDIDVLRPAEGDIHQVANAAAQVSVSIHVYGADIAAVERSAFAQDGRITTFISQYADWKSPKE